MSLNNHVIFIPGLGNEISKSIWATEKWKKFNIIPHVFNAKWKIEEKGFTSKLNRALKLVDSLLSKKASISIVGSSAGGSFALNLFSRRKKQIGHVVVNCGRVKIGDWPWFTFDQATRYSPSFRESVLKAQEIERSLNYADRKKIMTLRPIFDELVPPFTVPIKGAKNEIVPSIEHAISIALNMTLFKSRIINFILGQ